MGESEILRYPDKMNTVTDYALHYLEPIHHGVDSLVCRNTASHSYGLGSACTAQRRLSRVRHPAEGLAPGPAGHSQAIGLAGTTALPEGV